MRLAVTNSSTFPVLTAALGHYGNVPTRIKWMQRLLQQLFATEHLVFNNSTSGPSGTFLRRSTWGTDLSLSPPPPPSSKTLSHSSRPVRMSPPPGSLLGSQHAMGASDFLSSRLGLSGRGHPCLASRSFPPPPLALPPSPCSNRDLPPSPPRCVFWLLFSRRCRLSLGSNLCSPWSFLCSVLLP